MQWNTKLLTFFRKTSDAFAGTKSYDKAMGPQKHKHSPEIKTNCYFWTSSNRPSFVFSTNNLILDIFKWIGWFCWWIFHCTIFSYDWHVNKELLL